MYDLNGKVALVTGAGGERGIGRAITTRLASEGADVAVSDIRDEPREDWGGLSAVCQEIEALNRKSVAVTADVSDFESVKSLFDSVIDQMGRIDILVNNAGALAGPDRVPVVDLPESEWDRILSINLKGTKSFGIIFATGFCNRICILNCSINNFSSIFYSKVITYRCSKITIFSNFIFINS